MPAAKSRANHEPVENSGSSWSLPSLMSPYLEKPTNRENPTKNAAMST